MFGMNDAQLRMFTDSYLDWLEEQSGGLGHPMGQLHYALADVIEDDRGQVGLSDDPAAFEKWLDAARDDDPEEDD
jgi:hypothetical protein